METPKIESEKLRRFTDQTFSLNPFKKVGTPSKEALERGKIRRKIDRIRERREMAENCGEVWEA